VTELAVVLPLLTNVKEPVNVDKVVSLVGNDAARFKLPCVIEVADDVEEDEDDVVVLVTTVVVIPVEEELVCPPDVVLDLLKEVEDDVLEVNVFEVVETP
jgi:hypothetical protein